MKPSIKEKLIAFVEKFNHNYGIGIKCEFDDDLCIIWGKPVVSSVFLRMFIEDIGESYHNFYISVRDSEPELIVY